MKNHLLTAPASGLLLAAGLSLALSLTSARATPIPIVGSISFLGNATVNTNNLGTATAFTSFSTDTVDETSGAYSTIPTLSGLPVTFPSGGFVFYTGGGSTADGMLFSSTPVAAPLTTMPLWTFTTVGGATYSFSATGTINVAQDSSFLDLSGVGTANITGGGTNYAATSGKWTIEETDTGASFSFGASSGETALLPDQTSTNLLIGLGLAAIGMGWFTRGRMAVAV
jgi:hypothetical protein